MRRPRSVSTVESNDSRAWMARVTAAAALWSGALEARPANPLRTRAARLLRSTHTWAAVVGFRSNGMPRSTAVERARASTATPWAPDDHCARWRLRAKRKYSPPIRARPTTTMITMTAILVPETLLVADVVVVDVVEVADVADVVVAGVVVVVTGAVVTGAVVTGAVVTGAVVAGVVGAAVVTGVVGAAVVAGLVGGRVVAVCAAASKPEVPGLETPKLDNPMSWAPMPVTATPDTAIVTRAAARAVVFLFILA